MLVSMLNVYSMWLITGESNGTDHIKQSHDRDILINDAPGEIAQLKKRCLPRWKNSIRWNSGCKTTADRKRISSATPKKIQTIEPLKTHTDCLFSMHE